MFDPLLRDRLSTKFSPIYHPGSHWLVIQTWLSVHLTKLPAILHDGSSLTTLHFVLELKALHWHCTGGTCSKLNFHNISRGPPLLHIKILSQAEHVMVNWINSNQDRSTFGGQWQRFSLTPSPVWGSKTKYWHLNLLNQSSSRRSLNDTWIRPG